MQAGTVVLLLALAVLRAVAQTLLTCCATGGTWWDATENYPAACLFSADRIRRAGRDDARRTLAAG